MSEKDINTELEELLDAELTEEEVSAMETELAETSESDEEIVEAKAKSKVKKEDDDPEEDDDDADDEDESDDDDEEQEESKSKKSVKKEETENIQEGRMTKAKMLEDLANSLGKMKANELKTIHGKLKAIMAGDDEEDEEEDDETQAEMRKLEAQKKSIEERMKKISVKEDVDALVDGEDLSDEFKDKASTIFEAAVKQKVKSEIERLEDEYAEKLTEEVAKSQEDSVEKVDAYLTYAIDEWMKQNEVAIEHKLKTEITENFIGGLKGLFEEHNMTMPDSQYDMLDVAAKKADEMEARLNEQTEKNIELTQKVNELEKNEILVDVASDLADTEVEKFVGLAESVEYEDNEDFRKKLETIKESYFTRTVKDDEVEAAPVYDESGDMSNQMAAYMNAISKSESRAQK